MKILKLNNIKENSQSKIRFKNNIIRDYKGH